MANPLKKEQLEELTVEDIKRTPTATLLAVLLGDAINELDTKKLPLEGGTLEGNIDLDGNEIIGMKTVGGNSLFGSGDIPFPPDLIGILSTPGSFSALPAITNIVRVTEAEYSSIVNPAQYTSTFFYRYELVGVGSGGNAIDSYNITNVSGVVNLDATHIASNNKNTILRIKDTPATFNLGTGVGNVGDFFTIDIEEALLEIIPLNGASIIGFGKDSNNAVKINAVEEAYSYSRIVLLQVEPNIWKIDGNYQFFNSFNIFPDLSGSEAFPSSTNVNWTTATTGTPTSVAGTPTELRYTSNNNSGADFITQVLLNNPVSGDTYKCTGEMFYESGGFAHTQLRQVGGVNNKFEGVITNTTTWQTFDFNLTLSGTSTLAFDAASDGVFKLRNIRITKI